MTGPLLRYVALGLLTTSTDTQSRPAPGAPTRTERTVRAEPRRHLPSLREFFRLGLVTAAGRAIASFAGASLGFLWPSLRGGFAAKLDIGPVEDVAAAADEGDGHFTFPAGRLYLVPYDPALDPDGQYAEITNDSGFMALYHRCVHLGCRVPWCASSQWFECPCHGSRCNGWGEYQFGPAPRGLDRFAVTVEQGDLIVDTSTVVTGRSGHGGFLNDLPAGAHCT